METYEYHQRINHQGWLLSHIKVLVNEAKKNQNASFILYACLECRNLLEKTEFDILLMSTSEDNWLTLVEKIKVRSGIQNVNKELKTLKYRLQSFSECLSRVSNLPVKTFDYRKSEELQKQLAEYIHTYTRTASEMTYGSEFLNQGLFRIKETLDFIESYYVKVGDSYNFGILNFETLKGGLFYKVFLEWRDTVDTDTEALFLKLKKLNDDHYNGAKAIPTDG